MASPISEVASPHNDVSSGQKSAGPKVRMKRRGRPKSFRSTLARELSWLDDVRRGYTIEEIARREGLGRRRIQLGVSRAREQGSVSRCREHDSGHGEREPFGQDSEKSGSMREDYSVHAPRLVPLFPVGAFTPQSTCPHHGPIRAGSSFCCMVCSRSGVDDHPALKRDSRTEPGPDRKVDPVVNDAGERETRRQRRQRLKPSRQPDRDMAALRKDAMR